MFFSNVFQTFFFVLTFLSHHFLKKNFFFLFFCFPVGVTPLSFQNYTNDNVTTNTQNTFNTAHMNTDT